MSLSTLSEWKTNRFIDLVMEQDNAATSFIKTSEDWFINREILLFELSSLANDLDLIHKKINITTLLGSSVSAISGTAVLAGTLMAPATGGLSTVVVLGVVAGLAGGVTAVGSTLAEIGITRFRCEKIQRYMDIDKSLSEKLMKDVAVLAGVSSHLEKFINGTHFSQYDLIQIAKQANNLIQIFKMGKCALKSIRKFLENVEVAKMYRKMEELKQYEPVIKSLRSQLPTLPSLGDLTGSIKGCMSKVPKVAFMGLTSLVVAADIWCIVQTAKDMKKGSKSVVANNIREIIAKLKGGRNNMEKLVIELV